MSLQVRTCDHCNQQHFCSSGDDRDELFRSLIHSHNAEELKAFIVKYPNDFLEHDGLYPILAAQVSTVSLKVFCNNMSKDQMKEYGLSLLGNTIVWKKMTSAKYLIEEMGVNVEELKGLDVYDTWLNLKNTDKLNL